MSLSYHNWLVRFAKFKYNEKHNEDNDRPTIPPGESIDLRYSLKFARTLKRMSDFILLSIAYPNIAEEEDKLNEERIYNGRGNELSSKQEGAC